MILYVFLFRVTEFVRQTKIRPMVGVMLRICSNKILLLKNRCWYIFISKLNQIQLNQSNLLLLWHCNRSRYYGLHTRIYNECLCVGRESILQSTNLLFWNDNLNRPSWTSKSYQWTKKLSHPRNICCKTWVLYIAFWYCLILIIMIIK